MKLFPDAGVTVTKVVTRGDRDRSLKMDFAEQDGVFIRELEAALLDGRIDMAVHSLKDVPTEIPAGCQLAAVLERDDPRDVLITNGETLAGLRPRGRIGTSSSRRSVQLANLRPDLIMSPIRGNVDTRVRKVLDGEYDGVVLAAAGLARLGWQNKITDYLPLEDFLPAVGQAALVIETRANDPDMQPIVSGINHPPTWESVAAERAFLLAVGGGCTAPIAALATVEGHSLRIDGMVASVRTRQVLRAVQVGAPEQAEETGRNLARRLLGMGAASFIAEAKTC